jgi:hypothetical protein
LAELIAESLRCLDEGVLVHRAQAEVLARVLLGFPLHKGSLFQLLDGPGAKALEARVAKLLRPDEAGARALLEARGFRVR